MYNDCYIYEKNITYCIKIRTEIFYTNFRLHSKFDLYDVLLTFTTIGSGSLVISSSIPRSTAYDT